MTPSLIDHKQIRDFGILSGQISSGAALVVSGDMNFASGNLNALYVTGTSGLFGSLTVNGPVYSTFLSGILGASVVGSGISYFPSIVDVSGNNVHYYIRYTTGNLNNIVTEYSTQASNVGWEYLDVGGAWLTFPILGLTSAQQQSAIVKHQYVASGFGIHTQYFASVKPIYAGNITGQFFNSSEFYPDSQGYQVALVPSFAQVLANLDSRYVVKTLYPTASVVSGTYVSGTPFFFQTSDTSTFPTVDLATGRAFWDNRTTGLFVFRTGIGFTGFHRINNIISLTGVSGVVVNQPTGNIAISLNYGTGSGQPPSGNDPRFTSAYHQSGGPDPLNIAGLSGVAATGQPLNVYNQGSYIGTYPNLAFSGNSLLFSGDPLNNRNLIMSRAVSSLQGNQPSPNLDNSTVYILGTGNIFASGVMGTGLGLNILYLYDTGTQYVGVPTGGLVTGTAIFSGAGNTVVTLGPTTPSGRVIVISGSGSSSSTGGIGNVTGIGLNAGPLFTGAFGFSGSGATTVTMRDFGNGVSGFVISSSSSSSAGGVTGFSVNNGQLFTGAFSISGSGGATVTMQNFGAGVSGIVVSQDHGFMELFNTIGY